MVELSRNTTNFADIIPLQKTLTLPRKGTVNTLLVDLNTTRLVPGYPLQPYSHKKWEDDKQADSNYGIPY